MQAFWGRLELNVEVNDGVINIEAGLTFDTTRQIIYVGKGEARLENWTPWELLRGLVTKQNLYLRQGLAVTYCIGINLSRRWPYHLFKDVLASGWINLWLFTLKNGLLKSVMITSDCWSSSRLTGTFWVKKVGPNSCVLTWIKAAVGDVYC